MCQAHGLFHSAKTVLLRRKTAERAPCALAEARLPHKILDFEAKLWYNEREDENHTIFLPDGALMKILFIGNSATYFNDMPTAIFAPMCEAAGYDVEVTAITKGGYCLAGHVD